MTAAIVVWPSIFRSLICPLATRLNSRISAASSVGSEPWVFTRRRDSDNGSEFINQSLYDYCRQGGITFTRSRAWKKNNSAHVEQKNGAVVRQLLGYDRFASQAAYAQLRRVYRLARLHVNFFQPVQKLVSKHRDADSFGEFEASSLFCPRRKRANPVRKKLLLLLPEGNKYDYACEVCGTQVGGKTDSDSSEFHRVASASRRPLPPSPSRPS